MSSLSFLERIFPTQGLNLGFPHCRQILYQLSYQGSPQGPLAWTNYIPPTEKWDSDSVPVVLEIFQQKMSWRVGESGKAILDFKREENGDFKH